MYDILELSPNDSNNEKRGQDIPSEVVKERLSRYVYKLISFDFPIRSAGEIMQYSYRVPLLFPLEEFLNLLKTVSLSIEPSVSC